MIQKNTKIFFEFENDLLESLPSVISNSLPIYWQTQGETFVLDETNKTYKNLDNTRAFLYCKYSKWAF